MSLWALNVFTSLLLLELLFETEPFAAGANLKSELFY